ncbi:PLP-dependent aminotransferase family protein [Bacillus solimangrovi]|uniref:GntR family transcriptional regulator n=1 Tax=Bacillus solimangrovi TaxID=1305675 RepID=A0A1E5LJR5_9BACI|nr:PLP-dependent aminotransferase family protein [Bacillus solimangrovi]OEH94276.1 GntR family transcriptional regulator [Bacillus solimangrovi]
MFWLPVDRTLDMPLIRQVYEQIRLRILHGELQAEDRLPATRELASNLGVSRNVIIEAYEQLIAEGYLVGFQGSGTYVAKGAYLKQEDKDEFLSLFEMNQHIENDTGVIDFRSGIPALDMFPRKSWGHIAKQVCIETSQSIFGYDHPEGRTELRLVLAQYLKRTRGVNCHPDQLVITSGATQAFSLIANLLLSSEDEIIIEDPITNEIQTIFSSSGTSLYPIPVDEYGMKTDLLPANKRPKFIFVTPSHQFPLGGTLPIQRRIQLIHFARNTDCYIIEDDYDSEFRYQGTPVSSLQGLDPERVIYVGTFSKILSPGLRLGYLILPPSLAQKCKDLKWFMDLHTPSLEQLTLAHFIDGNYLERHIRKMKKVYQVRRDYIKSCLKQEFSNTVTILGDSTGLHLVAEFEDIVFSEDILSKITEHNVKVYPVESHAIQKGNHTNKIILGYGNLSKEEIKEGIKRLKCALTTS